MSIFNRSDETFINFLKKYWWIESLIIIKVLIFINRDAYDIKFGIGFILGVLIILWILYRLGME